MFKDPQVLFWFFSSGTSAVLGNFLLKAGVNKIGNFNFAAGTLVNTFLRMAQSWEIIIGFLLYGLSSILYLKLLTTVEVTKIYPAAVAYMSTVLLILGALFLRETLTINKAVGVAIIILGIYILSR